MLAACGKTPADDSKGDAPVMGVCIFAMEVEYFTNLAHWLEEAGAAHGWEVIVQSGDASNPASQVEIIETLLRWMSMQSSSIPLILPQWRMPWQRQRK